MVTRKDDKLIKDSVWDVEKLPSLTPGLLPKKLEFINMSESMVFPPDLIDQAEEAIGEAVDRASKKGPLPGNFDREPLPHGFGYIEFTPGDIRLNKWIKGAKATD